MNTESTRNAPPWTLLKDLAQHDSDVSVQALAAHTRRLNDAQAQLQMLVDYRSDYRARLDHAARQGIGGEGLRNFRVFLGNLEAAITQQGNVLTTLHAQLRAAREAWQKHQRRVGSYKVLDERQVTQARRAEERREQSQQDEAASRSYLDRAAAGD